MVQAAVSGAVDFSTADILDRHWWLKLRWTLDGFEDRNTVDVFRLQHAQHASVLDYNLSKDTFNLHWDGGNKLIQTIHSLYFPWYKSDKPKAAGEKYSDSLELWKARYGDIRDPKVREKFDRIAKALHKYNLEKKQRIANTPQQDTAHDKLRQLVLSRRNRHKSPRNR